jgi:hypothetical protein
VKTNACLSLAFLSLRWSRRACVLLLLLIVAAPSAKGEVIFAYIGGNQRTDGGQVVGASFTSFGMTLGSLGFFDYGGDGLAASYQLGLWDSSQNLLATATVTPSSPLIGDFRYASIPPITIGSFANPQTFTIGALLPPSMSDIWLDNVNLVLGSGFAGAGTGRFQTSPTLVFPAALDSSPYYVVNAGGAIPEPGTFALSGIGIVALVAFAARRRVGPTPPRHEAS